MCSWGHSSHANVNNGVKSNGKIKCFRFEQKFLKCEGFGVLFGSLKPTYCHDLNKKVVP